MSKLCCECEGVHFSIYSIVRQQSEGSYQKTDVEKTERAQEIIDSTHRHKNGGIYHRTASLFLLVFLFLGGWRQGGLTLLRPTGDAANQATNVRSLGQVQPGGYSGQTSVSPDKAMNLPLCSDNPSAPSRCRGRLKQQRQQQQQEGIYHEHHRCDCHIMLS